MHRRGVVALVIGGFGLAVLAIVAVTGSLIEFTGLDELVGGTVLLFGCLILLVDNIRRSARPRGRRT